MPNQVVARTGKAGGTSSDRRILSGVSAATDAPETKADGFLLQRVQNIHLLFRVGGTTPSFRVQLWWFSTISGVWHQGDVLVITKDDLCTIETQGLDKIYLQVTEVTGTAPTLNGWLALVVVV